VNRGPDSRRVLQIARRLGAVCLMGNHELRLLRAHANQSTARLDRDYLATYRALHEEDFQFLSGFPLTYQALDSLFLCVHGGFMPTFPWQLQCADVVTRIQVLNRQGLPCTRAACPRGQAWASTWQGPEIVLYGHTPGRRVRRYPYAIGLDTACVRGGRLTAYVYPEDRYVQVAARAAYW
jgi:hypothetical protein